MGILINKATGWLRSKELPTYDDARDDTQEVEVYKRTISDYAAEIQNAKDLVSKRADEYKEAVCQLDRAVEQFKEFCGPNGLDLPIEMERVTWPTKPFKFED